MPPRVSTAVNPIERRMTKFMSKPPSVRVAASVIVTATATVVVASGILMRLIDHTEYSSIWVGMWWALQTVTTVGYGDVTPVKPSGRFVASVVMLEGIAFLAITTAVITSAFVARAESERAAKAAEDDPLDEDRLVQLEAQLNRIEAMLRDQSAR